MRNGVPDTGDEQAILSRLAVAHRNWRDARPPPVPSGNDRATDILKAIERFRSGVRKPPDVEVLGLTPEDPVRAVIWSQLSVVGWRLYAKGGMDLLTSMYVGIERDQHPGFAAAVTRAWTGIGFEGTPDAGWSTARLG